jgi:hypothetical protein
MRAVWLGERATVGVTLRKLNRERGLSGAVVVDAWKAPSWSAKGGERLDRAFVQRATLRFEASVPTSAACALSSALIALLAR